MKKIVTHINPDLDAVCSVWILKRFLPASPAGGPGWKEAKIDFREADNSFLESDSETLYVDLGRGKLDHHQTDEYTSATQLCWEYILEKLQGKKLSELDQKAMTALVGVVTEIDNARDLNWEEINQNRYQFYLHTLIDGLRGLAADDQQVIDFGFQCLDAILLNFKNKIRAEEELQNKGVEFPTPWGKAVAVASANKSVLWRGEALGYVLVVKKDPKSGGVQIYARSDSSVDLTKAYNKVKEKDPRSDWFLHASKKLLLNQASVNPKMRPTKLSLEEIIKILTSE